jgi:hypothetical protein
MKYLIHCIFRPDANAPPSGFARELLVVEGDGLAAAVTPWPEEQPPLDASRLLAYEKAIASIHATRAVIPLRFGCVVEGESEVLGLMRERRAEYQQLLAQWEGFTEMGLRLWCGSRPDVDFHAGAQYSTEAAQYLAALRKRHPGLTLAERQCAARIAERLKGLYRAGREEAGPAANGRMLSLYFLVPIASVDDFREKVREIDLPPDMKLMVSGPWPPYNFASSAPG